MTDVDDVVKKLGQALGLFKPGGGFDTEWLNHPVARLRAIITNEDQRGALLELLDEVIPGPAGDRAGYHPLLWAGDPAGEPPFGNLFLVVEPKGGATEVAVAGEFHTVGLPFRLVVGGRVPLLRVQGSDLALSLEGDGELEVSLGLEPPKSAGPVGLDSVAVVVAVRFSAPAAARPKVTLKGFRLGTAPARDLELDANDLGSEAVELVLALLHDAFANAPEPVKSHLLPVLGLDPALPLLPVAQLASDPDAARRWFVALVDGGQLGVWFGHLASLFHGSTIAAAGTGTATDPFVAVVLDGTIRLALTLATADGRLLPGVSLRVGDESALHLSVDVVPLAIPVRAALDIALLPEASVTLRSPTPLLAPVLANDGITVVAAAGSARGGFSLAGGTLAPLLELTDVVLAGHPHPHIDLTNLDEVGGLAADAVDALLTEALGTGAAHHLLALIGVVAPTVGTTPGDVFSGPGRPRLDPVRLLADPLGAVAAFHREVLTAGAWQVLHAEAAALIGFDPTVTGTGTATDPWAFTLASASPVSVKLVAWLTDTSVLHVGGALLLDEAPFGLALTLEALRWSVPANGAPELAILHEHHVGLTISALPSAPVPGGTISATALTAGLDWVIGSTPSAQARLAGIQLQADDGSVLGPFDLAYPFTGPGAVTDEVVRFLIAYGARRFGGDAAHTALAALGVLRGLPGIPADFPLLGGDLVTDPIAALRPWVAAVVRGVSSDGTAFGAAWLKLLAALALGRHSDPRGALRVLGTGAADEPWRAALAEDRSLELLLWLDTGAGGVNLAALLAGSAGSPTALAEAVLALRPFVPALARALAAVEGPRLASGLERLGAFYADSDGIVPSASQAPEGVTARAPIVATHVGAPQAAAAALATEIGTDTAVLISAPFLDHDCFGTLIGASGSAHFDFRQPGIPPDQVDLRGITANVPFYTADLAGTDASSQSEQLARVLAQLDVIRRGVPVVLVAHSSSGLAAVLAAAAAPSRVSRVVALAVPFLGVAPPFLREQPTASALAVARAVSSAIGSPTLRGQLAETSAVIDGIPPLGAVAPIPIDTIIGEPPPIPPGVSVVAIPVLSNPPWIAELAAAITALAPGALPNAKAVGAGFAMTLDAPAESGDLGITTELRVDLASFDLASGAADARLGALTVAITLERPDDWLLGGPGLGPDGAPWPARIRRAVVRSRFAAGTLTTDIELVDASLAGPTEILGLGDSATPALLDALFAVLEAEPVAAKLIAALRALGVLVPDAPRLAADAISALVADGTAYIVPRLHAALAQPLYGHDPTSGLTLGPLVLKASASGLDLTLAGDFISGSVSLDAATLTPTGSLRVQAGNVALVWRPNQLLVEAMPWVDQVELWPTPSAPVDLAERVVFSAAAGALLGAILPGGAAFPPLDAILSGRISLAGTELGANPATIGFILRQLGTALGLPASDGLRLDPPGVELTARADSDAHTVLHLATTAPLGGVVALDLGLTFAGGLTVEPSAAITLTIPDPPGDVPDTVWRDVKLEFGLDAGGVALAFLVGATRVELLPSFGGWQSLLSGGLALLPHALDEITSRVAASTTKTLVLDVANALGLYDPTFSAHTAGFQALASFSFDATARGHILAAIAALVDDLGLPGTATPSGSTLTWTSPALPAPVGGDLSIALDWSAEIPKVAALATLDVTVNAGTSAFERVVLGFGADVAFEEHFRALASFGIDGPLGTGVFPRIELGARQPASTAEPVLRLLPLGTAGHDGPVEIRFLPSVGFTVDADALVSALGFSVLLPLLKSLLERITGASTLWPGGPTLEAVVDASGLFDVHGALALPPLPLDTILANIAGALSAEVTLGDVRLTVGQLGENRVGVAASGHLGIPIDSLELDMIFGEDGNAPDREQTALALFTNGVSGLTFAPALSANHFGVGVRGSEGKALLSTDYVRIGGADLFAFFDLGLQNGAFSAGFRGAGVEVDDLGISLGSAAGGNNAIASGLMKSTSSGDGAPAQPSFGVSVEYVDEGGEGSGFTLRARLQGEDERRIRIPIHAGFGPLHIDQVGVELSATSNPDWIKVSVDGGVDVSGFAAQVDGLAVQIPLHDPGVLSNWGVDLDGLGIAYEGGGVTVRGGLIKRSIEGGVEYAGMLMVRIQTIGAVAVGAWSKQQLEDGELDTFFVFAAVFVTISFPPYFDLEGFGGGFGYNRALLAPEDMNQVPEFPLVEVLDDPGVVDHPLDLLEQLRSSLPARRGSLWFAAGLRGALFKVVDLVAVLYVALDRGVEIGILGLARLAQPAAHPIVSIELALKARFSSAEGVLSIQAQLTDRSWLLLPQCQLTGGFALFIWFPRAKFVLTIGGYHPAFQPEPQFPVVPRLGFRCVLGPIQIKGESYFALTNSCVMAGTSLEAAYDIGWLRAWFKAWADFLLSWDPFHYDISIGIELGADFNIDIDLLFGTVSVHFSFSVGASLHLLGPPLHGEVHAELGPISLTVPFGDTSTGPPPLLTWPEFRDRYVLANDPNGTPVSAQPNEGAVPPPSGESPPDGMTAQNAWRFVAEFSFATTTAMPASRVEAPTISERAVTGVDLDFAPMGQTTVETTHRVRITRRDGGAMPALDPDRFVVQQQIGSFAEAIWHYRTQANAGTENVSGLTGISVRARAEPLNSSAQVPIATLVDVGAPLPLPFAADTSDVVVATVAVGHAAQRFAEDFSEAAPELLLSAASPARKGLGFATKALPASSVAAVARRTSPPRVAALSEGMDLAKQGRGAPPVVVRQKAEPPKRGLELSHATRFVGGRTAEATVTTARTTAELPRRAPPKPVAGIARLVRLPATTAKTEAARAAPPLPRGLTARRKVAAVVAGLGTKGLDLAAGAVQLYALPPGTWRLASRGDAARVVALGRAGKVLLDVEFAGQQSIELPAASEAFALWSLGRVASEVAPGFAALTLKQAPRAPIAVGWHTESHVQVVDPIAGLGRGCSLRWSHRARSGVGLVRASELLGQQSTVETTLPGGIGAVLVLAAVADPTSAEFADLAVGVSGGTLGTPLVFTASGEQAALYPVTAKGPLHLTIASQSGYRPSGVIGLRGRAVELAPLLHGTSLTGLVADGPLTADGSIHVTLTGDPA